MSTFGVLDVPSTGRKVGEEGGGKNVAVPEELWHTTTAAGSDLSTMINVSASSGRERIKRVRLHLCRWLRIPRPLRTGRRMDLGWLAWVDTGRCLLFLRVKAAQMER